MLIIDSALSRQEALLQNPASIAPREIIDSQRLLEVSYWGFDEALHLGQLVIAEEVVPDLYFFFAETRRLHFPIAQAIPAADRRYSHSDAEMMADNNLSGFNYRLIAGSTTPSHHATGRAFDVNPVLNPYIYVDAQDRIVKGPANSHHNPAQPGSLYAHHPLVDAMKDRGWVWGGDWTLADDGVTDFQHFEKPASE